MAELHRNACLATVAIGLFSVPTTEKRSAFQDLSRHVEPSASSGRVGTLESQALALMAVEFGAPFARDIRAVWQRRLAGRADIEGPPEGKPESGVASLEAQRLRAVSIRAVSYLRLCAIHGVIRVPLLRDRSGRAQTASDLDELATVLQHNPQSIAVFRWPREYDSPEIGVLKRTGLRAYPSDRRERLQTLRQRLREVRTLWVVDIRSDADLVDGVRLAATDVQAFVDELEALEGRDPTLASLVGSGVPSALAQSKQLVDDDVEMLRLLVDEAEDIWFYDRDVARARKMLQEAERFAQQGFSETEGQGISHPQNRQALDGIRGRIDKLRSASNQPASRPADVRMLTLLNRVTRGGLTIEIPRRVLASDPGVESPEDGVDVIAFEMHGAKGESHIAPWLYGVDVTVFQHKLIDTLEGTLPIEGVPAVLTNLATGRRQVRTVRPDDGEEGSPGNEFRTDTAHFRDLSPGTYFLQFIEPAIVASASPTINAGSSGLPMAAMARRIRQLLRRLRPLTREHTRNTIKGSA